MLWEWGIYTSEECFKDMQNIRGLERQIYDAVEYIYGFSNGIRIDELYKIYKKKILGIEYIASCDLDGKCEIVEYTKK